MNLFIKTLGLLVVFTGLSLIVLTGVGVFDEKSKEVVPVVTLDMEFLYPATHRLIGFDAKNRDGIIEYLQCRELLYGALEEGKPKLRIVLKDWGGGKDAAGDSVVAIYQTYADIPYHSVKVDCPKSKYPIGECWFIKYEDDEKDY